MKTSFELSSKIVAGLLTAGIGTLALGGCSAVEEHFGTKKSPMLAGACFTDYIGHIKDKDGSEIGLVRTAILRKLENELARRGHSTDTSDYSNVSAVSTDITNDYIEQYSEQGTDIPDDQNLIATEKPFRKALFSFCVDSKGVLTPGILPHINPVTDPLDQCNMIYENYNQTLGQNPSEIQNCLEGEYQLTPKSAATGNH